jgi:hypothetical protein
MVYFYRNTSQLCLYYLYVLYFVHLVGLIKEYIDQKCRKWKTLYLYLMQHSGLCMYFPTATLSLFQTPVPNYTDVDLSFSYSHFRSAFDFATMDQSSQYRFMGDIITVMTEIVEEQWSSPQLQEFMRLSKLLLLTLSRRN